MKCLVSSKLFLILTGVAQRERAGLITLRSLDRDESPVSFQFDSFTETVCHSQGTINAAVKMKPV